LGDDQQFLAMAVSADGIKGILFAPDGKPQDQTISLENASERPILITQYLGEIEIQYRSAFEFLIYQLLQLPWMKLLLERVTQWRYSRRTLVRTDRIDVLRRFIEESIAKSDFAAGGPDVMDLMHGRSVWRFPRTDENLRYYDYLLESLADAGSLVKQGAHFRLAPKALATIAEYEEQNRRHNDSRRSQNAIVGLTFAIVIIGLAQVWLGIRELIGAETIF
jgi:hypothetical protein